MYQSKSKLISASNLASLRVSNSFFETQLMYKIMFQTRLSRQHVSYGKHVTASNVSYLGAAKGCSISQAKNPLLVYLPALVSVRFALAVLLRASTSGHYSGAWQYLGSVRRPAVQGCPIPMWSEMPDVRCSGLLQQGLLQILGSYQVTTSSTACHNHGHFLEEIINDTCK